MGTTLDKCCRTDEEKRHKKSSFLFSNDFVDSRVVCSDKNDEKFYFIKNEHEIDKAINRFDELCIFPEEEASKLDEILNDLRVLRKKYSQIASVTLSKHSYFTDSSSQELLRPQIHNHLQEKHKKPIPFTKDQMLKNINNGLLLLEVQRARISQLKLIKSKGLKQPYIVIKIYYSERKQEGRKLVQKLVEVASFSTHNSSNAVRPEWIEFFQYNFNDFERRVYQYKVGISLYYQRESSQKDYKVGEEQMFAVVSLFDQKLQLKKIAYKHKLWNGTLAKVQVRFQFVHNLEELRARIYNDIKTKMEKLMKIRERHPVFEYGKAGGHSMMLSLEKTVTNLDFSLASSNHDADIKYFFK